MNAAERDGWHAQCDKMTDAAETLSKASDQHEADAARLRTAALDLLRAMRREERCIPFDEPFSTKHVVSTNLYEPEKCPACALRAAITPPPSGPAPQTRWCPTCKVGVQLAPLAADLEKDGRTIYHDACGYPLDRPSGPAPEGDELCARPTCRRPRHRHGLDWTGACTEFLEVAAMPSEPAPTCPLPPGVDCGPEAGVPTTVACGSAACPEAPSEPGGESAPRDDMGETPRPRWRWWLNGAAFALWSATEWRWAMRLFAWTIRPEWVATLEEIAVAHRCTAFDPPAQRAAVVCHFCRVPQCPRECDGNPGEICQRCGRRSDEHYRVREFPEVRHG